MEEGIIIAVVTRISFMSVFRFRNIGLHFFEFVSFPSSISHTPRFTELETMELESSLQSVVPPVPSRYEANNVSPYPHVLLLGSAHNRHEEFLPSSLDRRVCT